jgi:hypothetical protein
MRLFCKRLPKSFYQSLPRTYKLFELPYLVLLLELINYARVARVRVVRVAQLGKEKDLTELLLRKAKLLTLFLLRSQSYSNTKSTRF